MHENRPPGAQLLFDCGIIYSDDPLLCDHTTHTPPPAPYPQLKALSKRTDELSLATQQPLPLRLGPTPPSAARNTMSTTSDPYTNTILASYSPDGTAVTDYGVTAWDMAKVYLSPDAYHHGFDIDVDLKYAKYLTHP